MAESQTTTPSAPLVDAAEPSLLDQIVTDGRVGRSDAERERARDQVQAFLDAVLTGAVTVDRDTESALNAYIAQIDRLLSAQLDTILHTPDFQKLEATWRGLKYLLSQSETGDQLKIKIFNVSKKEVLRDLRRAPEFDQSTLFKKVYEEEFGTFGGAPFATLIGDYSFGRLPEDIELLERVSQVAAAAHAPFIAAASPEMFNLDSFAGLDKPRDLGKIFDTVEYAQWKSFRGSEDSRYVALTLPRVLMRLPYGEATQPVEAFQYEERVDGRNHERYLWANASWALAGRITQAFGKYGWCATIRGVESGGLVEGLPVHTFLTDDGDLAMKCPTEVQITDRRDAELSKYGFAALVHQKGADKAAFFAVQSCQRPKQYDTDAANANARISAQIPYIFAVSRFAHYLKAIMRDKLGSFASRGEVQDYLNRWVSNYVVADDSASFSAKAQNPLREARIEVSDIPGKPGAYRAVSFLRPHFQLDELTVSMRLVAELPAKT